jgi:transketolase
MTKAMEPEKLKSIALHARKRLLETVHHAGAGHTGGSLSQIEILVALYFGIMNIDPAHPRYDERDRFILSKGHAAAGYYTVLAARGYFTEALLSTFDREGSPLQGHPDMHKCPGVDYSAGSLGQGLSIAAGMAQGAAMLGRTFRTFVLLGDGECQEGQVWEAAMYAGARKIPRLIAIVDYNKVQLSTRVPDGVDVEPFADKWAAFNWQVLVVDGHDIEALVDVLERAVESSARGPVVVIANTVKGKGVSFIEGRYEWHGKAPDDAELTRAMAELNAQGAADGD